MPNFTDQELVQMSAGAQSMWLMSALTGGELIADLLEARMTIAELEAQHQQNVQRFALIKASAEDFQAANRMGSYDRMRVYRIIECCDEGLST